MDPAVIVVGFVLLFGALIWARKEDRKDSR